MKEGGTVNVVAGGISPDQSRILDLEKELQGARALLRERGRGRGGGYRQPQYPNQTFNTRFAQTPETIIQGQKALPEPSHNPNLAGQVTPSGIPNQNVPAGGMNTPVKSTQDKNDRGVAQGQGGQSPDMFQATPPTRFNTYQGGGGQRLWCGFCRMTNHTPMTCRTKPDIYSCFDCRRLGCRRGRADCPNRPGQTHSL